MKRYKKNGFTLIESLLGLMVSLIVSFLVMVLIMTCQHIITLDTYQQDQFAILQIRQLAALSSEYQVEDGILYLVINHEQYQMEWDKNRLVRTEGYEILLENIENAYFEQEDESVYLFFQKNKKNYRFQIL